MTAVPVTDTAYGHIETKQDVDVRTRELLSTEEAVREYFKDIPVMIQVARCESTFRHTLKNGTVLRGEVDSADTGVMQINTRYHGKRAKELGLNLYNLEDNMAYARYLYEKKGTQPWKASAPCWSRTLAQR